jgi:hypothetical protein
MILPCPSELALERHLLEPEGSAVRHHVTSCARCTARLAEMRRQGEEFQRYVFPATIEAVEAAARPNRWRLVRWLSLGPVAVGAAVALLLVLRPAAPPDEYVGTKGGLGLSVFVRDGAAVRAVRDGERVAADAALRFRVRTATDCRLWILSLDASGKVSRLYPAEGTGGAPVTGAAEIPGGAILDGQAGPERIFAVCTPTPSRWKDLAVRLKGAGSAGEALVRQPPGPSGLPAGTLVSSVLLEKGT